MEATTSAMRSDGALLAEFAMQRREEAFAEVVRRHGGMVLSACRCVLGDSSDAEDAAQAVFLTLARKAHHSGVQAHVVGWLHRVAWYVAVRAAKARAVRRRHEEEAARMRQETGVADQEPVELDVLHAGLAKLPCKYREALILHHLEGRSHAETAELVGCSVEAVAVRLHRGREMLRHRLGRKGTAAAVGLLSGAWGGSALASPAFVARTVEAASAVLGGPGASAAVVSSSVMAMSKGAMKMLFLAKMRTAGAILALLLCVGGVVTMLWGSAAAAGAKSAITGVIVKLEAGRITLQRTHGPSIVTIDEVTAIEVDDKAAKFADLKVGMSAAAMVPEGKPATLIRAYTARPSPAQPAGNRVVTGSIVRVDEGSIAIQPKAGPPVVVSLNAITTVKVNDKPATAAELQTQMSAGVFFEPGQPASEVRAYTPGTIPSR